MNTTPSASILPHLGSYWAGLYPDRGRINAWCAATAMCLGGLADAVAWAGACGERERVPLGRPRPWWPVRIDPALKDRSGHVTDLARCAALCDSPISTSTLLVPGVDFTIQDGRLNFLDLSHDCAATWWAWRAELASDDLHRQWGHLLGVATPPTPAWRAIVNAVLDATCGCTSMREVGLFLGAAMGQPVARERATVTHVLPDEDGGWVLVSDVECWHVEAGVVPSVAVGDVLEPGQSLSTALRIDEPRGSPPSWLNHAAVRVGPDARDEVVYMRGVVPVIESLGVDGTRRQSFLLGGQPDRIAAYWAACHARTPLPTLPSEVDPLELLFLGPWASGVVAVRIDAGAIPAGAPGLAALPLLRLILPPEMVLLVAVDLPALESTITGDWVDVAGWCDVADVLASVSSGTPVTASSVRAVTEACT